jgi:GPH family glycoside/pentoside/hexuronide:cation symporter
MFSLKAGSAIGSAVPAFILAAFGFMANQTQTPESLQGIRIMFNFVPAVFFFIPGVLMVFYKLNGVTVNKMERELLARRSDTPAVK